MSKNPNDNSIQETLVSLIRDAIPGGNVQVGSFEPRTDERDSHFANWAASVWRTIEEKCRNESIYLDSGYSSAELLEVMQPLIARAGYDLVYHALYCNGVEAWYRPGKDYAHPTVLYERKVTEHTNEIPDLTEWSEQEEE